MGARDQRIGWKSSRTAISFPVLTLRFKDKAQADANRRDFQRCLQVPGAPSEGESF